MSRRRDRERRPARRKPFRQPKKRILVVCEGKQSEPQYLTQFNQVHRESNVYLEIARETGVPKTLVQIAKRQLTKSKAAFRRERDPWLLFDEIWCVFDVDEHPNFTDAVQMARANGIELAISNPNFELWLLLHFQDSPGMQHRDQIASLLRRHVTGYEKHVDYITHRYADGYSDAVMRARRLDEIAENAKTPGHNPTTGVYRLTESIRTE